MWNQADLLQVLRLYEQHYNDHRPYCCPDADVLIFGFSAGQRSGPDNALPPDSWSPGSVFGVPGVERFSHREEVKSLLPICSHP
jgi:hypothetical protein